MATPAQRKQALEQAEAEHLKNMQAAQAPTPAATLVPLSPPPAEPETYRAEAVVEPDPEPVETPSELEAIRAELAAAKAEITRQSGRASTADKRRSEHESTINSMVVTLEGIQSRADEAEKNLEQYRQLEAQSAINKQLGTLNDIDESALAEFDQASQKAVKAIIGQHVAPTLQRFATTLAEQEAKNRLLEQRLAEFNKKTAEFDEVAAQAKKQQSGQKVTAFFNEHISPVVPDWNTVTKSAKWAPFLKQPVSPNSAITYADLTTDAIKAQNIAGIVNVFKSFQLSNPHEVSKSDLAMPAVSAAPSSVSSATSKLRWSVYEAASVKAKSDRSFRNSPEYKKISEQYMVAERAGKVDYLT